MQMSTLALFTYLYGILNHDPQLMSSREHYPVFILIVFAFVMQK